MTTCSVCYPAPCPEKGERLKAEALGLLEAHRDLYVLRGRRALLECILCVGQATADDVRDAVELPAGLNAKLFGVVPSALVKAGIIRPVGFVKTCRPTAHARPVTVWRLADRAAAERWLRDHPDLGDSPGAGRQRVLFPLTTNDQAPTVAAAGAGQEV